jgi:translation elongation factor EF-Tu-like GTPase
MNRPPDAIVLFRLMATDNGGKERSVISGYRPNYAIRPDYLTSVNHEFIDVTAVAPGSEGHANVWFITPEAYPRTLWPGREIQISEGAKVVGSAIIISVLNPILASEGG